MKTIPTFRSLSDAIAAGYREPLGGCGRYFYSVDRSGGKSVGYHYSLHLRPPGDVHDEKSIGRTVTVHLTEERNAGCYLALYPPKVVGRAQILSAPYEEADLLANHVRRERQDTKDIRRGRGANEFRLAGAAK